MIIQAIHPDDRPGVQNAFEEILTGRESTNPHLTLRVKGLDTGWVDIEGSLTGMLNVPGVNGVVANFRDVSELRKVQSQIRKLALLRPANGTCQSTVVQRPSGACHKILQQKGNNCRTFFI